MTNNQLALPTVLGDVLADPDLAHSDVFRRMPQAEMQDLVEADAAAKPDLTAFAAMPREHWRKVWENNRIERLKPRDQTRSQRYPDLPQSRLH